jgi:hypothetical protein
MKFITNSFLIIFTSIVAYISGDSLMHTHHPITNSIDTTHLYTKHKIDSIDKKIINLHEETVNSLEANHKVLQNTEKKLLYLDLCLDSVSLTSHMEDSNSYILSPLN